MLSEIRSLRTVFLDNEVFHEIVGNFDYYANVVAAYAAMRKLC